MLFSDRFSDETTKIQRGRWRSYLTGTRRVTVDRATNRKVAVGSKPVASCD